jgi:hypothetical protein
MPWDAGPPVNPLDEVQGEEVTDDEPPPPAPAAGDAGLAPEADAGSTDAAAADSG